MSFLYPGWLLLLLILPLLLLGAFLTHRNNKRAWQVMVAPRLRKQLVVEGSSTRGWISLVLALIGCALIIVVIARPYQGENKVTEEIRSRNILIAVDTSRSMLVRDVSPDRIGSAKAMAIELKDSFPNDRIGVIAFSGVPVLIAPLTIDHSSVHETLSQLDTNVIPSGGSDLAAVTRLAIEIFRKSGHQSNALVIISDGEDHSEQIGIAGSDIREAGITVCTLGVGTSEGGMIPDSRTIDDKFRDINGNTVHSRLNSDALKQLSGAGRGIYVTASGGADLAIRKALAFVQGQQQTGRKITIPNEIYPRFLLPAIVLLILSVIIRSNLFIRRTPPHLTTTAACLMLMILSQPLGAANSTQEGALAYRDKDYEKAKKLFNKALTGAKGAEIHALEFYRGSSAYRLQQWDIAARCFSRSLLTGHQELQEQSHYNLGNTLFQSGWTTLNPSIAGDEGNPFLEMMRRLFSSKTNQPPGNGEPKLKRADIERVKTYWQDALKHYQSALLLNTENKQAADNLREVRQLLKQLKEAEEQAKQEANDQNKNDSTKDDKDQSGEQPKQKDQGDQSDENQGGEGEKNQSNPNDKNRTQNDDTSQPPEDDPNQEQAAEPRPDETEEAFAARILRELSDAETRPLSRRFIRLRRPAKDW